MVRRRSSGVQDFLANFNAAYDTASRVAQDFEIAKVMKADAPQHSQGFTADQGNDLQKLAGQGYEIGFDQGKNAYTATKDGAAPQTVAMQGVTDFMGQRQAGTLSADQVRSEGIADVFAKYNPERGIQMRNQLRRDAREDQRFGREQKKWASEDSIEAIGKQAGEAWKSFLTGDDGKERAPTISDFLTNQELHAAALMQAGHSKEAMELQGKVMASRYSKVQLESAERKQALGPVVAAAARGDYGPSIEYANNYLTGGASRITNIEVGKDDKLTISMMGRDGNPVSPVVVDKDTFDMSLRATENPNAAYEFGERNYRRMLDERREKRADRADARAASAEGRAAATHAQAQGDRRALMEIRGALANEAGMNPTQIEAVRRGVLEVPGRADSKVKYDYDPVKIQKAFGETSADPITGKETVKRNSAEETKFMEFMADNPSIKDVDQGLMLYNQARVQRERKAVSQQDATRAKVLQNITPEKLAATAKKYNMTVDQVRAELEKSGIAVK